MQNSIGLSIYYSKTRGSEIFNGLFRNNSALLYSERKTTVHEVEDLKAPMYLSSGKYSVFIGSCEEVELLKKKKTGFMELLKSLSALDFNAAIGNFFKKVYITSEETVMAVEQMIEEKSDGRNFLVFHDDGTVDFKDYKHRIEDVLAYLTVSGICYKIYGNMVEIYKPKLTLN
tara:strand:- start:826 stop:1344 length:519 start_codon:yes stop_codon:yes gene_type:complete